MKKLLALISLVSVNAAFASQATYPIECNNGVSITASSTLADVQKCLIKKQKTSGGLYEVKFVDNNDHSYECKFATNSPTEVINSCEN
ncbi:MAG: hypothetical protein EKK64_08750 [Neisseriaceae bacterium]|jgi:hypothetical protein|nr:MAG: hypothetical protein EKK64_08750 [Neisseriaceae bacterium]